MVAHAFNPQHLGGRDRRIFKKHKPFIKKQKKKKKKKKSEAKVEREIELDLVLGLTKK